MSSARRRLTSREPARLTLDCSCLGGTVVTRKEDTFGGQEDLGLNSTPAADQLRDHVQSALYMGMAVSVSWKHCRHQMGYPKCQAYRAMPLLWPVGKLPWASMDSPQLPGWPGLLLLAVGGAVLGFIFGASFCTRRSFHRFPVTDRCLPSGPWTVLLEALPSGVERAGGVGREKREPPCICTSELT